MQILRSAATTFVAALALPLLAGEASAQTRYLFSIDWQGATVGMPSVSGAPITEGDILAPSTGTSMPALAAPAPPMIAIPHGLGGLGLATGCAGHAGGTPCNIEVDALSRGIDFRFQPNVPIRPGQILFSVDEYAVGLPAGPMPNVVSEAPFGDGAADSFVNLGLMPPAPLSPMFGRHVGVQDGDGFASGSGYTYPGVGIREPIVAAPGPFNGGDNIDALDAVEPVAGTTFIGTFFSLDSSFPDFMDLVPNTGSAIAHGFVGGDVLVATSAGTMVYAPATMLGLDLIGGPDSDDLDALILAETGAPGYQPSFQPYDWMSPNADMLIFSVRRGSAVIGMPDSMFGLPIQEGDLLIPPIPTALGGVSPFPAIFIAAENLGLSTLRFAGTADDLCAADALHRHLFDCDGDGVEDAIGIAAFGVADTNMDGVPDSCVSGPVGTPYCFCTAAASPCGNAYALGGCLNATGTGAVLSGSGSTSVGADNLVLTTTGMNPGGFALSFMSVGMVGPLPVQNGLLCAGPSIWRLGLYPTGPGTASFGPGLVALTAGNPPAGQITAFATWNFQTWYRDLGGPCGGASNFSNALTVTFVP
ncbi:MAG: hypothetical protein R3F49_22510 [Planctomycetota bacterium]